LKDRIQGGHRLLNTMATGAADLAHRFLVERDHIFPSLDLTAASMRPGERTAASNERASRLAHSRFRRRADRFPGTEADKLTPFDRSHAHRFSL